MITNINIIVLAAGLSSRMGEVNKLLIEIDGIPMVRRSVELYRSLFTSVTVVTGHQADEISAALTGMDIKIVHNLSYEQGQPSSVRCGMTNMPKCGDGVLIALADQPSLSQQDISSYVNAFLDGPQDKIFIPFYGAKRGNPVLFPSALMRQVKMSGRAAACRKFIDENPELTHAHQVSNAHFTTDVDTPQDARNWA